MLSYQNSFPWWRVASAAANVAGWWKILNVSLPSWCRMVKGARAAHTSTRLLLHYLVKGTRAAHTSMYWIILFQGVSSISITLSLRGKRPLREDTSFRDCVQGTGICGFAFELRPVLRKVRVCLVNWRVDHGQMCSEWITHRFWMRLHQCLWTDLTSWWNTM